MSTTATVYADFPSNANRGAVLDPIAGALIDAIPARAPDRSLAQLYKGGSAQWFVTYELGLDGDDESCPQVTRVYLSGELCGWELGSFATRSGNRVYGVKIEYQRAHDGYRPRDEQGEFEAGARSFAKIIELPLGASNVALRSALPDRYRHALHRL